VGRTLLGRIAASVLFAAVSIAVVSLAYAQEAEVDAFKKRIAELERTGRYAEAADATQKWASFAEKIETAKGKPGPLTANALGNAAWYALLAKHPERALPAAERALKLAPDQIWIEIHRAHALLFLGRTPKAITAYLARKGEAIPGHGKWEERILNDFAEFRKHRLQHADMARVESALAKAPPSVRAQAVKEVASLSKQVDELYVQGNYEDATVLAEKAVSLAGQALGKEHLSTLASVSYLAVLFQAQGRLAEAETLHARTLEARERMLGKEHSDTLASMSNLATVYSAQGRLAEAELLDKRGLDASERVLGREHPGTLTRVNNLAYLYLRQGRYAEAEPLLKRALEARERVLGNEHSETLSSVNNLAALYRYQGRHSEAEALFSRALEVQERVLGKEHPNTLSSVNNLATLYQTQGRYAEAEAFGKRALEGLERVLGREHSETLTSVSNLAAFYAGQGRYAEAEPLLERAFETSERVLGKEHPGTLQAMGSLAVLYVAQGRYAEAEPLMERAFEASERMLGSEHPDTLASLISLAALHQSQGRHGEAGVLYRRALEAHERVLGKEHPDTLTSVNSLAELYHLQGRYAEAEPLYSRTLETRERVLGKEHPDTLTSVNNLAALYLHQGRYAEAEPLQKRTLDACERVLGKEHPATLTSVNNLAFLYQVQARLTEAEPLYNRALAARERVLGKEHPATLTSVNNLALLYQDQGRLAEAGSLFSRALESQERALGKEHPDTLKSINNLAALYLYQGRHAEAEPLVEHALEARERILGKEHPDTLRSVNNLAALYRLQGRYSEAEPFLKRALEVQERVLGQEHPDTLTSVNNLAAIYFEQRGWDRAAAYWRRSTAAMASHELRGARNTGQALGGKKASVTEKNSWQFKLLVKTVYRLAPEGHTPGAKDAREMFVTAQWAESSEAAASLAQMAARGASKDAQLAAQVRKRQDLLDEWQGRDKLRNTWLGQPAAKRNAQAEEENGARLAAIDARIQEIDKELVAKFPDYAALASPAPLGLEEVQAQLRPDEALVFILDTPAWVPTSEETFIWVVTKTDMRWVRSGLGTETLTREVQALRCGLDGTAWDGKSCADLTGQTYTDADRNAGKPLPFDYARAHKLYLALFGQVEDLIEGKELLIVPSGPLTQLPFQVLVTAAPAGNDPRKARWLIRNHALSVLPAVSSLKALRRAARPSSASKPMIGFGNPLLDGPDSSYAESAQLARDYQQCQRSLVLGAARAFGLRGGLAQIETHGGRTDIAFLRKAPPLPETAGELCAVARDLNADASEILIGARASEREAKRLSESGQLAQYRIMHFATHGALAGQVQGNAEPGLLLTPPAEASEEDDGYLTASEIAALKLDADWVILSACNTAAGGAQGAEALSGLARAFIYAQARALLVSHWEVDSAATVKLVTEAMRRLTADKSIGRAEAMRQSMLALIDKGEPQEAHPVYWAPFVVVGEGGAGK
jgi:CHAT domain-containing protein